MSGLGGRAIHGLSGTHATGGMTTVPPPTPPSRSDADVQAEASAARQRKAAARSRAGTQSTVGDDDSGATKNLLGA